MEGLRPDRDEVDSFQRNRKSGGKKSSSAPEAKTSSELKPNKKRPVVAKEAKSGSSIAVWIMMAVIAGAVSWFGWEGYKQQQSLKDMHTELNDALVFLRQSKLLMARLEGELSETGAELEESGTDAQKKLKFLDSEVRKLWGVAYDRNRKSIAVNDGAIKQQDKTLKQQASLLKDIDKTLKQEVKGLTELTTKTEKSITSTIALQSEVIMLRELNDQLSSQLKAVEEASGSAIADIRQNIDQLKSTNKVEGRVRSNEVAIEAIDASRLQLNERIVAIDRRLNDLQLSIKSAPPAQPTGVKAP